MILSHRFPSALFVAGLTVLLASAALAGDETVENPRSGGLPPEVARLFSATRPAPSPDPDAIARGSVDWAALIDSTWGPSTWTQAQRSAIFDDFWDQIDSENACFQDLDTDWDAIRSQYRAEAVAPSISAGRFYAILAQLTKALQEGHTFIADGNVGATTPAPGVPLFQRGPWANAGFFGASVTPLLDGTALVYDVVAAHPLGLEPGDRILGYDGRSWDALADELLDVHELPITGHYWASDDEGFDHVKQGSVGMNWHLFSTLDVLKHSTGEVQHLDVSPLGGLFGPLWATEQLDVPGIPKPDITTSDWVTHGILPGTNIGYINALAWSPGSDVEFELAVDELTQQTSTDGLVIDFRFNLGGNMFLSNPGLSILFTGTVPTVDFVLRCGNPNNHLSLCALNSPETYEIPGNPLTSYTNPIAVLNGPATISSGDQVSLRMTFLPNARSFGKSTSTTFNSPADIVWSDPAVAAVFQGRYCQADAYLLSDPAEYLTHDEQPVDCSVWLEPDDVAQGIDTVLQTAIDWIEGTQADSDGDTVTDPCDNCVETPNSAQTDSDLDGAGDDCDCAPGDPTVFPGAIERNDGVDNQCAGEAGFGVVDETGDHSGFLSATDGNEYVWIGQLGATEYDVARSTSPDFSTDCVLFISMETRLVDTDVPPPGTVYHYLNRTSLPAVGSWGQDSNGVERVFTCM